MAFKLATPNGYDLFEMSSMIQKAIRRSDIPHAAYAANELAFKYRNYLWKRLLTVSAEDCYGIMTKEIVALQEADKYVNAKNKPGDTKSAPKSLRLTFLDTDSRSRYVYSDERGQRYVRPFRPRQQSGFCAYYCALEF